MLYLYGKSIQNCNWEYITQGELIDLQKYSEEHSSDYVSFHISEYELKL